MDHFHLNLSKDQELSTLPCLHPLVTLQLKGLNLRAFQNENHMRASILVISDREARQELVLSDDPVSRGSVFPTLDLVAWKVRGEGGGRRSCPGAPPRRSFFVPRESQAILVAAGSEQT